MGTTVVIQAGLCLDEPRTSLVFSLGVQGKLSVITSLWLSFHLCISVKGPFVF